MSVDSLADSDKILPSNPENFSGETSAILSAQSESQAEASALVKSLRKMKLVPEPEKHQRKTKTIKKTKVKKPEGIKCPYCYRIFLLSQALGGHVSKSHPGESKGYANKKKVRDSRDLDRECLAEAKKILAD